jgi:HAD superfamily hydrolase (TIGR01549 family)
LLALSESRDADLVPRRVDAVTFDVGNTLLFEPERASRTERRRALKSWLRDHGAVDRERLRSVLSSAELVGSESPHAGTRRAVEEAENYILASLGLRSTDRESARFRSLVAGLIRERCYRPAEGVADALRDLREQGIGLGIVSNRGVRTGRWMVRQLDASGLTEFFTQDAISWSDEVGFRKPDPRIFLSSLRALEARPDRAAHVGNKKAKDVEGARRVGMETIRYAGLRDDEDDGPEADTVIFHYDDLAHALGIERVARRPRRSV